MKITRRKFLKYLACAVPAFAIAPAAAANLAAEPWGEWLTVSEFKAYYGVSYPDWWPKLMARKGKKPLRLDNNPLFKGELGIYSGVTMHRHK
jgi:hypothetical protein